MEALKNEQFSNLSTLQGGEDRTTEKTTLLDCPEDLELFLTWLWIYSKRSGLGPS